METSQELQHWGIKGQKWGIRRYQNPDGTLTEAGKKRYRYQNPDGSLTEEGKKDYMTAAKKGKLDLSKLSDNDLNMINSRFARENTYKQNIQKYEESKFSNQLKKAIIDRVRGNGGGNNSKGKSKSKGGIASLLAMPIKKAFEDAFKDDGKSSGGNDDKEKQKQKPKAEEDDEVRRGFKQGRHFARYGYKESDELRESRIKNGKRFLEGSLPLSMGPNRTAEDIVRDRRTRRAVRENDEWWRNSMESPDSWGWSGMHGESKYAISRTDELYHWGIKGQKWGVRRFENPDGTLTEEGKARYHSKDSQKKLAKAVKKTVDSLNPLYDSRAKKVVNSPQVKDALAKVKDLKDAVNKAYDEYNQMEYDWYNRKNPKMYDKYTRKYAEKSSKEYGDGTKDDIETRLWLIRNDDLDQGESYRMYLNDNPKEKAKYDTAYKKWNDAVQKQKAAVESYASEWLGDYGNEQIKSRQNKWNNYSYTVSDALADVMSLKLTDFYNW